MACVPPRAGSDAARQLSVAQGVQLSKHCKMKQNLFRSSMWHKACKIQAHIWHVRTMASEAVVIEEMEASDFNEKKTMRWQRWQAHETMVLIAAKKQQDLGQAESAEAAGIELKKSKNKWKEIEVLCQEKGIERSAEQCQTRWSRLTSAYTQIKSWEDKKTPEQLSFWSMKLEERKSKGFALILDQKTYNALDELHNSKGDDIKIAVAEDDVEEKFELGSTDHTLHENDWQNYESGEVLKGNNENNALTSGFRNDGEVPAEFLSVWKSKCEGRSEMYIRNADGEFCSEQIKDWKVEKRADPHEDMESTKIFCTSLHDDQIEGDGSIKAQLLLVTAGKMDCSPNSSQHADDLGTTEHTNPMFCSDKKDVNNIEIPQLFHASKEMDGKNKDQYKRYSEGHINVMRQDDNNSQFSQVMYDGTMPAARDKGIKEKSKGADGISLAYHETNFFLTDSLEAGPTVHANNSSALVENLGCQETFSHLSFAGADVLDENQSGQVVGTAGSYISMDEQGCKNFPEERNLATEACLAKSKKGEGFSEPCKDKNTKDISNALINKTQLNFMEAEPNNDRGQMVEGMMAEVNNSAPVVAEAYTRSEKVLHSIFEQKLLGSNPFIDVKDETGRDRVFEHGLEDDNTLHLICSSENSDNSKTGGVENMDWQKNQYKSSREDHMEMTAGIEKGMTSVFEHNIGHIFTENTAGELQNGSDAYNRKTTEHSQSIEYFEVAVDKKDSIVKRELRDQLQLVNNREVNDPTDGLKVAIDEGVSHLETNEIWASPADADSSAVSSIQHQFHHEGSALELKGSIKGDNVSSGKHCEVKRVEASETAAAEVEFGIKDGRGSSVTSGNGAREDQSQKSNNRNKFDEDVFLYIPATIGSLVRSVVQAIRNFLKS